MEIPSSKVPLAQKLLATECGLRGTFCVCATQVSFLLIYESGVVSILTVCSPGTIQQNATICISADA